MSEKVALSARKRNPYAWKHPDRCETDLVACLPFFKSESGKLTHRVRLGTIYWDNGKYKHMAVVFHCGGIGFPGYKGKLMGVPAPEARLCAVCEARAGQRVE